MNRTNAVRRSVIWLGAALVYAFLKKPAGESVLAIRADALGWIGAGLVGAGFALHCWSNVVLARGERAPGQAPAALAVAGPYRFVRNPIYLAGISLLCGVGLLYAPWRVADLVAMVVLLALFHLRIVRLEEPALGKRFGASYSDYCQRVPRWLPRQF
jgi:protein-S-isoprenylcysteine O-methyltransferase Ste14